MISFSSLKVNPQGLMPCIVIDAQSKSVLMQAYMNEAAFNQTIKTGQMTYYSRSRGQLWIKGETSGNRQSLVRFFPDCDRDCLLFEVIQQGPACHTGSDSCFYESIPKLRVDALLHLEAIIAERRSNPQPGAYTTYLFQSGLDKILKKVGEEASEVLIASKNADPNALLGEIADLMYHLHVLLAEKGLHFSEVTEVLASRMMASADAPGCP